MKLVLINCKPTLQDLFLIEENFDEIGALVEYLSHHCPAEET
jgi:hypothetical protein